MTSGIGGVRSSTLEAIGGTPVARLRRLAPPGGAEVLVKLEFFSPTGSYKDRMALAMIEGAERRATTRYERRGVHRRQHRLLTRLPLATQRANDEADIRRRIDNGVKALHAMDLESVMSIQAPDIVSSGIVSPPWNLGAEAKRKQGGRINRPPQHHATDRRSRWRGRNEECEGD